jgi:hypothetical protein
MRRLRGNTVANKNLRSSEVATAATLRRKQQGQRLEFARLAVYRKTKDPNFKTASSAAMKLEIAGPTYLAHENGTRQIRDHIAEYYGRAYGVSADWILFGTGIGPDSEGGGLSIEPQPRSDDKSNASLPGEVAAVLAKAEAAAPELSPAARAMIVAGLIRTLGLLSPDALSKR